MNWDARDLIKAINGLKFPLWVISFMLCVIALSNCVHH